mmetsp:Transcript_89594/g.278822  ORF Transcript_89594/g.278822 Transcript_89594/m.278822 type:complete len:254 (-) Transcript_89594:641-1402(-)
MGRGRRGRSLGRRLGRGHRARRRGWSAGLGRGGLRGAAGAGRRRGVAGHPRRELCGDPVRVAGRARDVAGFAGALSRCCWVADVQAAGVDARREARAVVVALAARLGEEHLQVADHHHARLVEPLERGLVLLHPLRGRRVLGRSVPVAAGIGAAGRPELGPVEAVVGLHASLQGVAPRPLLVQRQRRALEGCLLRQEDKAVVLIPLLQRVVPRAEVLGHVRKSRGVCRARRRRGDALLQHLERRPGGAVGLSI